MPLACAAAIASASGIAIVSRSASGRPPLRNRQRERLALDQLHREEQDRSGLLDRVDRDDVRMVQRGGCARFTLEPAEPIGISGKGRRQDFDRDVTAEARVAGAVHLAHAAAAEQRHDLVGPKRRPGGENHLMWPGDCASLYPTRAPGFRRRADETSYCMSRVSTID